MGNNAGFRYETMTLSELRAERKALCGRIAHSVERRNLLMDGNAPVEWVNRYNDEINDMEDELTMLDFYLEPAEAEAAEMPVTDYD